MRQLQADTHHDRKLFTKVLASRLEQHLPQLVHLDQVGFILTRDNTVKVLNLIHVANATHTPSVFLGTNAEKAFDQVNWRFMFLVLWQIGLRNDMFNWITKTYFSPTAQFKANGVLFDPFSITDGTRQGCPLSPLLFALSLEPFLCKICLKPDITGIVVVAFNTRCNHTPTICFFP